MPRCLAKTQLLLVQFPIRAIYASVNYILYNLYNGMSFRRQVVIWTNADPLSIGPIGTNIDQFAIKISNVAVEEMWSKFVAVSVWQLW